MMLTENIEEFMRESNWIEGERGEYGEGKLHLNDIDAASKFLALSTVTEKDLLELHKELAAYLNVKWAGKYRTVQVYVGKHIPPAPSLVPMYMQNFWDRWPKMNAHEAHISFESIHPFQDLNGRTGRLIWLWKKVHEENWQFQRSFLHEFYYDTLTHSHV